MKNVMIFFYDINPRKYVLYIFRGARIRSIWANLLGDQGLEKPSVVVSLKVHLNLSGFRNRVFITIKLLKTQKSINSCLFSLCSSDRACTCWAPNPKTCLPTHSFSISLMRPCILALASPRIYVGMLRE